MARSSQTKADRRQGRNGSAGSTAPTDVQQRLARLEEAVAGQSERDEELLSRITLVKEMFPDAEAEAEGDPAETDDPELVAELTQALQLRRESVIPVDQPLTLICQAQRSGGTLLARLFDGHPQCHAHPHELHIGDNRPHVWPKLALDESPESWFDEARGGEARRSLRPGKEQHPAEGGGPGP